MMQILRTIVTALMLMLWLSAIALGFAWWDNYDYTPGRTAVAVATETEAMTTTGWKLTIYIHPQCPCTRASLAELSDILERPTSSPLSIRVVFFVPSGAAASWADGELKAVVEHWTHTEIAFDFGGIEIRRSGVTTSGTIVLHDPMGHIAFRGGINRGRGRTGESPGKRSILDLLTGHPTDIHETPVYGCSLLESDK